MPPILYDAYTDTFVVNMNGEYIELRASNYVAARMEVEGMLSSKPEEETID